MNKMKFVTKVFTIPATALLLSTVSCQTQNTPNPATGGLKSTPEARQFANKTNDFSFDLLKRVNDDQKKEDNIFVSPLSLHMALGMLLNGADAQTAQEMQKTMKLEGISLTDANQTYKMLIEGLPGADPKVTTSLANSVWYRNTFAAEPAFLDETRKTFSAEVSAEDFKNPATVNKINQWASDKTNGKIKKVLEEIKEEQVLFLLNALYFKGDWKYQFDPGQTNDAPFQLVSGQQKNVRMMSLKTSLRHAYRPNYGAFELPYGDGTYTMTVLLPNRESSADAVINSLSAAEWADLQQAMKESKTQIGLPKFNLEYEVTLNDVLKKMGMPTAFTDNANFSKISKNQGLKVSFVKQNTFVAVDEKGTEAAAVTSIGVELTSVGPEPLVCNRPFVFLITEKQTGSVLFMGKIVNPEFK